MKKAFFIFLISFANVAFLLGCSDDEKVNPEDTLEEYIEAWETHEYDRMVATLHTQSIDLLEEQEWSLPERMGQVYEDLGVDQIQITYESRDFEEEEIDWEVTEELQYPIEITMATIAGNLRYETTITLLKKIEEDENDEEREQWYIEWHPSHIFVGLDSPTDKITVSAELPKRGEIVDRSGRELAVNGEVYEVGFVPNRIDDFDQATEDVARLFNMDVDRVRNLANAYPNNPDWFAPVQRMPLSDARLDDLLEIGGVLINRIPGREYQYGESLAQLIGYIGPITAEELEALEGEGYTSTSVIGKRGLESVYEERLRGERGVTIAVTDEAGNTKDVIIKNEAIDGETITLTIDAELQEMLANTIGDDYGAGVVMNPTTGEVLALVSQPSYDSNFNYLNMRDPRTEALDDINVLYERRFQYAYSPGSVFKPFTAAIGIEEGTLDPNETITITDKSWQPEGSNWGGYEVVRFYDHVTNVDLNTGMKYSDNIYFAQQALHIGAEKMESWAEVFGFEEPIPFEFPLYASNLANESLSSDILVADTGYGQGQVQMNVVHLSTLYTMFVNDGSVVQPVLLEDEATGEWWKEDVISEQTAAIVLDSIISVTNDPNGTAYRENLGYNRSMAGKTGTAELKDTRDSEDGKELGWYVALDYDEKDILVTMMIEHVEDLGGSGYVVDLVNEFLRLID
ncbi:penicillin-binding transpeptidase domain-containing protein [Evansella sp. AB-P1]|uniref:penicillin-binding transpeptidase domain-containing protein n=1 Tax=Evansella sp. AB-P1 TaxID=3037653 RepID=UPI00241BFB0E|nr:penicillin-binding transpeptidase domain-containing protein [Evansella sp. AB-P1]MDG5786708.1 penicillin-binding transpeptidase domain-containing protein [Evansella sp. AB-P1]